MLQREEAELFLVPSIPNKKKYLAKPTQTRTNGCISCKDLAKLPTINRRSETSEYCTQNKQDIQRSQHTLLKISDTNKSEYAFMKH